MLRGTVITVTAVLSCTGCTVTAEPPDAPVRTSSVPSASAVPAPTVTPWTLTAVLVRARTASGRTSVTYRPAKVEHVVGEGYETVEVTVTGPPTTLPLSDHPRILLCVPLTDGVKPKPVTVHALLTGMRRNREYLSNIGFDLRIDAHGRISYLEQYFRP